MVISESNRKLILPMQLRNALNTASLTLESDFHGHLPLPERLAIWKLLGSYSDRDAKAPTIGDLRRAELSLVAAADVIHIWNSTFDNPIFDSLIEMCFKHLSKRSMAQEIDYKRRELTEYLQDLAFEEDQISAFFAAESVLDSATLVLGSRTFDPYAIEPNTQDEELDSDRWDSSYFAAAAFARGLLGDPQSNATKRREFWRWYLAEAVPEAWSSWPEIDVIPVKDPPFQTPIEVGRDLGNHNQGISGNFPDRFSTYS